MRIAKIQDSMLRQVVEEDLSYNARSRILRKYRPCSAAGLTQHRSGAQTHFVDDVKFLGVKPFDVGYDPEPDEQRLLGGFGRAHTGRSECELVWGTSEVREYIEGNCHPADPYLRAIRRP